MILKAIFLNFLASIVQITFIFFQTEMKNYIGGTIIIYNSYIF